MNMNILHVKNFSFLGGHGLALEFSDGSAGEVDLADDLKGEIFVPLRDHGFFIKATLEGGTITWPNGADMAPEYLKERCRAATCERRSR